MTEQLRVGDVLCSEVSDARFLVLETGATEEMPSVNGQPLFRGKRLPCSSAGANTRYCELQGGRRYLEPSTGLTLLCIQPGQGTLRVHDLAMLPEPTAGKAFAVANAS